MVEAAGFWSYTHADDRSEEGRILRLATLVQREYRLITGEDLGLFVDRSTLEWGDDWQERIDEWLLETTFFIPIVTPQFFRSEECRRELLTFTGHARRLGMEELLLPILYSGSAPSEEGASDEAMALIARTQWEDWRDLRLEDESSSVHRKGVHKLARRLAEVADRMSQVEVKINGGVNGEAEPPDDESPGLVELVAQGEDAMPRWVETVNELGRAIQDFGEVAQAWQPHLQEMASQQKPTSEKLGALRRVSEHLDEPATRIEKLGREYAAELVSIDPAVLSLLSMWEQGMGSQSFEEVSGAEDVFESILRMAESSRSGVTSLQGLVESLESLSRMSRDMRRPLRKARSGLRNVIDGQSVIDEWETRIRALQG